VGKKNNKEVMQRIKLLSPLDKNEIRVQVPNSFG
jgi:hypothetical protein